VTATATEPATKPGPTPEQLTRVMLAADAVHAATCHRGAHEDSRKCRSWKYLVNWATLEAMDHLIAHPKDAAGARGIFHDAVCYGGAECTPVGDHAKRTQSKTVAALRKYVLAGEKQAVEGTIS
jgi:hypothetical protein